ncbi:hypothetical protein PC116_g13916 [Phytophthora cactorum]|nr:hypothetical protein PC116_g13916 [Phytophthora cactorum]
MRKLDGQFECHRVESSNDKTAIPLVLLNETFARFEQNCKQFEFGNADCDFVLELCGALLFPYEIKEEFAQKAQDLLEGYLIAGYPEATMWPMVDQGSVSHGSYRLGETLLLNLSCRLQKGYGGGDPTMENIAYYIKILPKVIDRQFPCFLLDICGPLMSVYGIVNTGSSDVICEPLVMSFPLIFFRNNWLMESLVRMCASLKAAVKELRDRCFQLGRDDAYQSSIDSRSYYTEMTEALPGQKHKWDEPPGAMKRRRMRSSVDRASAETARSLVSVAVF